MDHDNFSLVQGWTKHIWWTWHYYFGATLGWMFYDFVGDVVFFRVTHPVDTPGFEDSLSTLWLMGLDREFEKAFWANSFYFQFIA